LHDFVFVPFFLSLVCFLHLFLSFFFCSTEYNLEILCCHNHDFEVVQ
jgi:hypothetical protein